MNSFILDPIHIRNHSQPSRTALAHQRVQEHESRPGNQSIRIADNEPWSFFRKQVEPGELYVPPFLIQEAEERLDSGDSMQIEPEVIVAVPGVLYIVAVNMCKLRQLLLSLRLARLCLVGVPACKQRLAFAQKFVQVTLYVVLDFPGDLQYQLSIVCLLRRIPEIYRFMNVDQPVHRQWNKHVRKRHPWERRSDRKERHFK